MNTRVNRGGTPPSQILFKVVEILEDGEWHFYEEVLRELGKLVPPGKAVRMTEKVRTYNATTRQLPSRRKPLSLQRQIESGKRTVVKHILESPGKSRYFEITKAEKRRDDTRLIRMIQVPSSIQRARELQEAGKYFDAAAWADRVEAAERPRNVMDELHRTHLEQLALELLERLREARWELQNPDVVPSEGSSDGEPQDRPGS